MLQFLSPTLSQVKTVEFTANQFFIRPISGVNSPTKQLGEYQVSASLLSQGQHVQVVGGVL